MSADWQIVALRVLAMAAVAAAGWGLRRRGALTDETTRALGRLVVDVSFPALTFAQMLRSATPGVLATQWLVPLLGLLVLGIAALASAAVARFAVPAPQRKTFIFLGGMPNWIFLPLPIAQALYGDAGVQAVLLINVAMQICLWTFYVALLRGGLRGAHAVRGLFTNAGFLATLGGIAVALLVPSASGWERSPGLPGAAMQSLQLLGSLTVPLSLIVTGAQLAGLRDTPRVAPGPTLWLLATRLVLVPAVTIPALLPFAERIGGAALHTVALVALMPVAVTCGPFVDRFGGDRDLAARGIGYTTLAAVITVPLLFALL